MERSREEWDTRLKQQIQFIVEVDKVKNIFRQTELSLLPGRDRLSLRVPALICPGWETVTDFYLPLPGITIGL